MYGLNKKQKLKFIIEKVIELDITSYEIGKKTGLSISGIDKLISGTVKNPHENTLNTIIEFLENKVLGSNLNENNTQNVVEEPFEVYEITPKNCIEKLENQQKEIQLKDQIIELLKEQINLLKTYNSQ